MARTPIWRTIANTLTAEIADGQYQPGDKLPTEAQLAARFDVNRHTIRHALASMSDSGLVISRRGAGVFVAQKPTSYALGRRVRFSRNLLSSGRSPNRKLLSLETRVAGAREREALKLGTGDLVHVYEGISLADDQPIAVFRSVFPASTLPGLPAELEHTSSTTAALKACGVADYTRVSTRINAKAATATQARLMQVPEGAPILRSIGISEDTDGRRIEYGTTWFAGDRVTLTLDDDALGEGAGDPENG